MSPILSVKEMADYLRVDPSTIYRLVRRREIPAFRVSWGWRFNLEHVKEWAKAKEIVPR